jgi:hypothetical protein
MKQFPHTHVVQCNKMFHVKILCQRGYDNLILTVETHWINFFLKLEFFKCHIYTKETYKD